jgi:hypothetical protein
VVLRLAMLGALGSRRGFRRFSQFLLWRQVPRSKKTHPRRSRNSQTPFLTRSSVSDPVVKLGYEYVASDRPLFWFGRATIRVNPIKLSFQDLLFSGDLRLVTVAPILEGRGIVPTSSKLENCPNRARPLATMIEPIIIRHLHNIADAQQDLAASLNRAVIIADKIEKQQSELVATLTAHLEEAIAAVLKVGGHGPTAAADPIAVGRVDGLEQTAPQ